MQLSLFNLSVGQTLWAIFWLALIVVAITTLAFYYHWGRFSPTHIGAIATIVVYTIGVAVLFIGMLSILISF